MADVIMLAERPSNVSARSFPAAPSAASFADSAVSDAAPQAIGNYKGVMLCNRPGVIADTPDWLKPAGNELPVFRAGVPHEVVHPRGRDTLFDRPPVTIPPRKKRHDAMEAHRSWLTSLIQRRAALQVCVHARARALEHRARGLVRCVLADEPVPIAGGTRLRRAAQDRGAQARGRETAGFSGPRPIAGEHRPFSCSATMSI